MNANIAPTATAEIIAKAAEQATLPPWRRFAIYADCWVPVMHDGDPCLESCVNGTVGAFATKAEAEAAAYNCTCYGGPNTVEKMRLRVKVEKYVRKPGFAGYYSN